MEIKVETVRVGRPKGRRSYWKNVVRWKGRKFVFRRSLPTMEWEYDETESSCIDPDALKQWEDSMIKETKQYTDEENEAYFKRQLDKEAVRQLGIKKGWTPVRGPITAMMEDEFGLTHHGNRTW